MMVAGTEAGGRFFMRPFGYFFRGARCSVVHVCGLGVRTCNVRHAEIHACTAGTTVRLSVLSKPCARYVGPYKGVLLLGP